MTGLERLQPWLRGPAIWLYDVAVYNGLRPRVTSVIRTYQQQAALHRHNPSGLPAAAPGTSKHEVGRAFDLVVADGRDSAAQRALGELWVSMGGTWGGRWTGRSYDPVHFAA